MDIDANTLSSEEWRIWQLFLRGSALIQEQVNQDAVRDAGLSVNEFEVLAAVSAATDHKVRMSHLAQDLVHSRSRLTHAVRRLEEKGYVARLKCSDDGRGIFCALTDSGKRKFAQAQPVLAGAVQRRFIERFSEAEYAQLGVLLDRLLRDNACPAAINGKADDGAAPADCEAA